MGLEPEPDEYCTVFEQKIPTNIIEIGNCGVETADFQ